MDRLSSGITQTPLYDLVAVCKHTLHSAETDIHGMVLQAIDTGSSLILIADNIAKEFYALVRSTQTTRFNPLTPA